MPKKLVHWKLMGRAACKPTVPPDITDATTTLCNDVTCPKCRPLVMETWRALIAKRKQPEPAE